MFFEEFHSTRYYRWMKNPGKNEGQKRCQNRSPRWHQVKHAVCGFVNALQDKAARNRLILMSFSATSSMADSCPTGKPCLVLGRRTGNESFVAECVAYP